MTGEKRFPDGGIRSYLRLFFSPVLQDKNGARLHPERPGYLFPNRKVEKTFCFEPPYVTRKFERPWQLLNLVVRLKEEISSLTNTWLAAHHLCNFEHDLVLKS